MLLKGKRKGAKKHVYYATVNLQEGQKDGKLKKQQSHGPALWCRIRTAQERLVLRGSHSSSLQPVPPEKCWAHAHTQDSKGWGAGQSGSWHDKILWGCSSLFVLL